MSMSLSPNTQAILLLTAPLIAGRKDKPSEDLLRPAEYNRLAQFLLEEQLQPEDLLTFDAGEVFENRQQLIDKNRLERLLARGFLLSQAIERWQTRAIWVVSRADVDYPRRLKTRLKEDAPSVLYGCGDATVLDAGGLAVVGSRNVDDELITYTEDIGGLAAKTSRTLISGGARGIDQAAMRGALEAGGKVTGVLANSLERMALSREHRNLVMDGRLVLVSPYDPMAGFNVGHAMQRNKLIYALADAALVVSSDYQKGGIWTGAIEQLERLRLVPVYVRPADKTSTGLKALQSKGALPWPNPETPEGLTEALTVGISPVKTAPEQVESPLTPADELFAKVRELLEKIEAPTTDAEVAADLHVSKHQAKEWLQRLVEEGVLEKHTGPVRYAPKSKLSLLE